MRRFREENVRRGGELPVADWKEKLDEKAREREAARRNLLDSLRGAGEHAPLKLGSEFVAKSKVEKANSEPGAAGNAGEGAATMGTGPGLGADAGRTSPQGAMRPPVSAADAARNQRVDAALRALGIVPRTEKIEAPAEPGIPTRAGGRNAEAASEAAEKLLQRLPGAVREYRNGGQLIRLRRTIPFDGFAKAPPIRADRVRRADADADGEPPYVFPGGVSGGAGASAPHAGKRSRNAAAEWFEEVPPAEWESDGASAAGRDRPRKSSFAPRATEDESGVVPWEVEGEGSRDEGIPRFRRRLDALQRKAAEKVGRGGAARGGANAEAPAPGESMKLACPACDDTGAVTPEVLGLLEGALGLDPPVRLEEIAFLDTETTGLAGGAGTFPFLVGIGWFEGIGTELARFVVEQYFLEDYCHEEAQIGAFLERLGTFRALCTYNGKAFDLPVLQARLIYLRRSPSVLSLPHIDLLASARRLWRKTLGGASLKLVEAGVLGIERTGDIDGALIPKAYFAFLRGHQVEQIAATFDHNAQDIASLGALLARVCGYVGRADHPALSQADEWAGLGGLFLKARRMDDALRCLENAVGSARGADEQDHLLLLIARLHKRARRWGEAVGTWERLLGRALPTALRASVELAKYWEHRAKDPARAQAVTEQAIARLRREVPEGLLRAEAKAAGIEKLFGGGKTGAADVVSGGDAESPSEQLGALQHRLARLERRRVKGKRGAAKAGQELFPAE